MRSYCDIAQINQRFCCANLSIPDMINAIGNVKYIMLFYTIHRSHINLFNNITIKCLLYVA